MTPNPDTQAIDAGWIKTAKVGDKVVCADACKLHGGQSTRLQEGEVYTVAAVQNAYGYAHGVFVGRYVAVRLAEVCHPISVTQGFAITRFRPVIPRKTDISFAHEILRKASRPVKEDA
jgi:hypothetical protein